MLSLEFLGSLEWTHNCGAVLINERHAITAAHCVDGLAVANLRLKAGALNRTDPDATNGQTLQLLYYTQHPDFQRLVDGIPNNLAIITLLDTARLQSNIQGALLPPDDSYDFNHGGCFMAGYGRTTDSPFNSQTLQWRQIIGITNQDCQDRFTGIQYAKVLETHICTISDPPQDGACNGDAGGALYCHPTEGDTSTTYLTGVLSWFAAVTGNCNLQFPVASSRISKYLDWISENTKMTQ
jgi:secreted trypsin-like serine protease